MDGTPDPDSKITDEDWADAQEMPVSDEQNSRLVVAVDSGTAIWKFSQGWEDGTRSFPLPVYSLMLQTKDTTIHQFFLTPQVYVSLMGEIVNHMWRLWGSDTTALTSADALDEFLAKMMEQRPDNDDDDYTPGGYA